MEHGHGKDFDALTHHLTDAEKLAYLCRLPQHKLAEGSKSTRMFDVGTLRPWTDYGYRLKAGFVHPSIDFLLDELAAGSTPLDIAFLSRRDYWDVLAMCRIAQWMEREARTVHLTAEQKQQQQERKEQVLVGLSEGMTVKQAAQAADVNATTVFDWKKTDPAFATRYEQVMEGRLGRGGDRSKIRAAAKKVGASAAATEMAEAVLEAGQKGSTTITWGNPIGPDGTVEAADADGRPVSVEIHVPPKTAQAVGIHTVNDLVIEFSGRDIILTGFTDKTVVIKRG